MQTTLTLRTTVLPGHRIEVETPDLPEGANVELTVHYLTQSEQNGRTEFDQVPLVALNVEYETLIQTQWQRNLTQSEQARLQDIKAQIDAKEATSDTRLMMDQQIAKIHHQLAAIRKEIEALPDAS